jgi:hypothetical protein
MAKPSVSLFNSVHQSHSLELKILISVYIMVCCKRQTGQLMMLNAAIADLLAGPTLSGLPTLRRSIPICHWLYFIACASW